MTGRLDGSVSLIFPPRRRRSFVLLGPDARLIVFARSINDDEDARWLVQRRRQAPARGPAIVQAACALVFQLRELSA